MSGKATIRWTACLLTIQERFEFRFGSVDARDREPYVVTEHGQNIQLVKIHTISSYLRFFIHLACAICCVAVVVVVVLFLCRMAWRFILFICVQQLQQQRDSNVCVIRDTQQPVFHAYFRLFNTDERKKTHIFVTHAISMS